MNVLLTVTIITKPKKKTKRKVKRKRKLIEEENEGGI